MRREYPNIDLKHLQAMAESNPPQYLQYYADSYAAIGDPIAQRELDHLKARAYVTMNRFEEAKQMALDLLSTAVEDADYLLISKCNVILSICHGKGEEQYKQKPFLEVALDAAIKAREEVMIVECLALLGVFHQKKNEIQKALEYLNKADKQSRKLDDPGLQAKILIGLGGIYYNTAQYDKALVYMGSALDKTLEAGDSATQLLVINNLGTLYTMMHRFEDAESILKRGLKIADDPDSGISRVRLMFNHGVLHLRQDRFQEGLQSFLACKSFADSIGFSEPRFLSELYNNLAGCCRYLGDSSQALDYLDQTIRMAGEVQNKILGKETELNMANLLISIGRLDEAKTKLDVVGKFFRKHKLYDRLSVYLSNLAEYHIAKKDYPKAIKTLKEISPLYQEYIGSLMREKSSEYDRQIEELMDRYETSVSPRSNPAGYRSTTKAEGFIGVSKEHRQALEAAMLAAKHPNANVFITGESGTGKEVIAGLIHSHSVRKNFPLVPVNVSAVSAGLVESEFFGHKKGAFTSAVSDHVGYFTQANRGTLFLDEIGDMPPELQAKLLRALESRKFTPVGSTKEISYDCRVISSTNRNVVSMMQSNLFRLDLFHRLNTVEIHLAPLRERKDDIRALTNYYVDLFAKETRRRIPRFESGFIEQFCAYSFPGNVRELKNLIERLFILNPSDVWDEKALRFLPISIPGKSKEKSDLIQAAQINERELIINALIRFEGKQKEAAKALKTSESTLSRKIARHKLEIYTRKGR